MIDEWKKAQEKALSSGSKEVDCYTCGTCHKIDESSVAKLAQQFEELAEERLTMAEILSSDKTELQKLKNKVADECKLKEVAQHRLKDSVDSLKNLEGKIEGLGSLTQEEAEDNLKRNKEKYKKLEESKIQAC